MTGIYNKVKDYKQSDYAAGTWAAFEAERTKAKALLDQADPDDAVLSGQATELERQAAKLVNISKLAATVAKVSSLNPANYTEFSWYLITFAVDGAKSVLADPDTRQYQVDDVDKQLNEDINNLKTPISGEKTGADVPAEDKTLKDLEALITQAEKLQQKDYTAASWAFFASALKDAKDIDAEWAGTADISFYREVNVFTYYYVQLEDAQSALVPVASQNGKSDPAAKPAAKPANKTSAVKKKAALAQTGVSISIVAGVMVLFAGVAAAFKLSSRKRV